MSDLTTQYGFERIPIERWLDIQLNNTLEVMNIRLKWFVLGHQPKGKPYRSCTCQTSHPV